MIRATTTLIAVACGAAVLAGCGGGGTPEQPATTTAAPSASSSPITKGSVDPAADDVPLEGTDEVRIQWKPSKDQDAPVVEAARKFELLYQLGYYQPGWATPEQLRGFVDALSTPGVVPASSLTYWNRKAAVQAGTVTVTMSEPEARPDGTARIFACTDAREILQDAANGMVREFTMSLDGSTWRVSEYDARNPDPSTDFFDRCKQGM